MSLAIFAHIILCQVPMLSNLLSVLHLVITLRDSAITLVEFKPFNGFKVSFEIDFEAQTFYFVEYDRMNLDIEFEINRLIMN